MNLQNLYEAILKTNIINFCIMIGVLIWIFKYFKLGKIIDSMEYDIKNNVTSSVEAVQNALRAYKAAKKESKNAPAQKQEIIKQAEKNAQKLEQKREVETKTKQNELELDAKKALNAAYERKTGFVVSQIQNAIATLSIQTIKSMLNDEIQQKIIENSLNEFDKIKGGSND